MKQIIVKYKTKNPKGFSIEDIDKTHLFAWYKYIFPKEKVYFSLWLMLKGGISKKSYTYIYSSKTNKKYTEKFWGIWEVKDFFKKIVKKEWIKI